MTRCDADEIKRLESELRDEKMEHNLLKELLSRPEIDDFWEGIVTEAAHQRQRWGDAHDRNKSAENWFWLVGYLSGKALRAAIDGDKAKAQHHTISTAAALFQWHQAIRADETCHGIGKDEDIDPDGSSELCDDCPPVGYITDATRCAPCPRRTHTALDTVCLAAIASNEPCRSDDTMRCTICGFVVDTRYAAEPPNPERGPRQ